MQIQKQKNNGIEWINIVNATDQAVPLLQSFGIHPLHIEDALEVKRHSKLERHKDYTVIVSRFPIYNPKTREIKAAEVDFFIFPTVIITCHNNEIPAINAFFRICKEDASTAEQHFSKGPGFLLYALLEKLFDRSMPMIDHIAADIDVLQKRIFKENGIALVEEILLIQRNIIDFVRIFKPQISILLSLASPGTSYVDQKLRPYFQDVASQVEKMKDILSSHKETIEVMRQANESLINDRSSKALKLLTIYSLVTGPFVFLLYQVPWNFPVFARFGTDLALFASIMILFFSVSIGIIIYFRVKRWY